MGFSAAYGVLVLVSLAQQSALGTSNSTEEKGFVRAHAQTQAAAEESAALQRPPRKGDKETKKRKSGGDHKGRKSKKGDGSKGRRSGDRHEGGDRGHSHNRPYPVHCDGPHCPHHEYYVPAPPQPVPVVVVQSPPVLLAQGVVSSIDGLNFYCLVTNYGGNPGQVLSIRFQDSVGSSFEAPCTGGCLLVTGETGYFGPVVHQGPFHQQCFVTWTPR